MPFQFSIAHSFARPAAEGALYSTLTNLGLTTNLKLCVDAGDILSITSSSPTKWLDRSGGGYDFYFGSGSGPDAADPTFSGTPGRGSASEYLLLDGTNDLLTYDSTNETWMQALHKDNALWGACGWTYKTGGNEALFGTQGGTPTDLGVAVLHNPNTSFDIRVGNGATSAFSSSTAIASVLNRWLFWGFGIDEAGNAIRINLNGAASSGTCTYSSPSASSAAFTMQIGALGGGSRVFGGRFNSVAMWQGTAPSAANLAQIFNATRGKFSV